MSPTSSRPAKAQLHFVNIWLACDLRTLLAIVRPHWIRLSGFRSWLVLALVATVATLNSLLGVFQNGLLWLSSWRSRPVQDPLFVIGHWRSGTTVLHQLLALDPQFTYANNYVCFCPHHFLLTEWLLADGFDSIAPLTRLIDELPLDAASPQEDEFALLGLGAPSPYRALAFPASGLDLTGELERERTAAQLQKRWRRTMAWFVRSLTMRERKRVVLKSPPHTLRIQTLLELYPNAQFVWISRHPAATMASTIAMWKRLCRTQSFCAMDDSRLAASVARSLDTFAREIAELQDHLQPGQLHHLSFEALLADPIEAMQKLYSGLQLGPFRWSSPPMLQLLKSIKSHTPTFPSQKSLTSSVARPEAPTNEDDCDSSLRSGAQTSNRAESYGKQCISE